MDPAYATVPYGTTAATTVPDGIAAGPISPAAAPTSTYAGQRRVAGAPAGRACRVAPDAAGAGHLLLGSREETGRSVVRGIRPGQRVRKRVRERVRGGGRCSGGKRGLVS